MRKARALISLLQVHLTLVPLLGLGQVSFSSSNLPIIVISTNGQEILDDPKITADMGIIYNGPGIRNSLSDPFNNYDGKIGIEIRGSSSQSFPKKQYGIELQDGSGNDIDASLLGMPAESDWVLFAPYNDKSLMRDALAYKLGRDQGRYAPRTRYCEVVLNGEYMGVYVLIEKIKRDANRVNINKLDPDEINGTNLTGGYIIKIDKTTGSGGDGWNSTFTPPNRNGNQTIFYQYEVPKASDIVIQQQDYIKGYINEFENALASSNFTNPGQGYAKYIDVDSFIDYFLVNEVSKNPDAYRLSTFLYKQRQNEGGKMYMGPIWDFNLAFGNVDYCTNGTPDGFVTDFNMICPDDWWLIPFWWGRLIEDPSYRQKLGARWSALRNGPYKTSSIHTYIDSVANVLNPEAQQRNFQRWPVLGQYVWPNYYIGQTFQQEVDWLKNWVAQRLEWLDANMPLLITSIPEDAFEAELQVYPNPVQDKVLIQYTLVRNETVLVDLLDNLGRSIRFAEWAHDRTGTFEQELLLTGLTPGVYVLKVRLTSGQHYTRKLIKNL